MVLLLHHLLYYLKELQKGVLQTHQTIYYKRMTLDNLKCSIPISLIVQQYLVVYLADCL